MLETRLEGNQNPRSSTPASVQRLYEDPDGVDCRITVPGHASPLGWGFGLTAEVGYSTPLPTQGDLAWNAIRISRVRLDHAAHLLLIEGAAPSWLFLGATLVGSPGKETETRVGGPFLLLQGTYDAIHQVPFCMHDVVLAHLPEVPKGIRLPELLPLLIHTLHIQQQS